jgi:hypothetical protein
VARTLAAIDVNGLARHEANLFTGVLETCVTASLASSSCPPHRGQKGSDLVAVASSCYLLYSLVHIYEYMDD